MNWKEEAVDKLRKYPMMVASLENLPAELQRLELDARVIAAADPRKIAGGGHLRSGEDALLSNVVHRQELEMALQQAKCWVGGVDRALETLPEEEKTVLMEMYARGGKHTVDNLCEQLAAEKSTIYRRRDQALRRFTMALYGVES